MLDEIKSKLGIGNTKPAEELSELANVQAALSAANLLVETKTTELASVLEKLASFEALASEMGVLKAAYDEVVAKLAQAEEFSAMLAAKAVEEKNAKRLASLESLVGTSKASATFSAVSALDDTAFEAVCAALETAYKMEEQEVFQEVGAGVVADTSGLSPEAKMLQEKYKNK